MLLTTHRGVSSDPLFWFNPEPEAAGSPARPAAPQPGGARAATPSHSTVQRSDRVPAITDQGIIGLWNMRVEKKMAGGLTKAAATRETAIEDPKFHQQYLDAYKREMQKGRRPAARRD